ncbi:RNA polymerase sigma factor [Gelidibacter salicanalis]|uniref:RNA polymerase sigma factor n=1 Tax=Gelidibacter salicanalis TaxID=291193 RepID=UPI001FE5E988|nr:RNA polymerase sigma factor [Gelidibacter salicanalis]
MNLTLSHIKDLLEQCKLGNERAQMEVYRRYFHAMYNTSYRIVKDRFEAEDIMQESFLTAFTKLDTLNDVALFGPWLKRIIINNSISVYRMMEKELNLPLDDRLYKVEDCEDIEDDYQFTNVKSAQIMECMKNLKANYRLCLTLNLIEGYDYDEICEIMGISYAHCRTMISRAKESLRQKLNVELKS